MSWILKDTVNGTKIYQWDTNYATRNLAGSGQMSKAVMSEKDPVAHDPDGGTQGNTGAKAYAESIVNQLKNYDYVIGTQAACGTDSAYIAVPLDYSMPHCGNFEWNNSTWGAEKYGEDSKQNCAKTNKVFYDLSVYANKKYGSKVGSSKLHNELSATSCPAKSVQFFGSNQAVKDNINSNSNVKETITFFNILYVIPSGGKLDDNYKVIYNGKKDHGKRYIIQLTEKGKSQNNGSGIKLYSDKEMKISAGFAKETMITKYVETITKDDWKYIKHITEDGYYLYIKKWEI